MPDNPLSHQSSSSSLDLSSITNEFLNSPEVTGAQAATPPPQETQDPVTPPAQEEVTPPLTPQGQEPPPTPEEQQRGYLRDSDYRQKTMKLAEEKRQWEAQRQQEIQQAQAAVQQQYEQALANAQFLQERWHRIHGTQPQQRDPNQPLSAQEVQQLLQQQVTASEQKVAQYIHQLERDRHAAQFDQERALYAQALLKEFSVLEDQEGVDRLISAKAWERKPSNMNELKQFMREEAETRAKRVQKRIDDNVQAAIMRQAKAAKPSIEPQGGKVPVLQTPQRRHKLGSSDLFQSVLEDIKNDA